MPNIDTLLGNIMEAKYGEAVRKSIHDAIDGINEVVENWEDGRTDPTLTSERLPAQAKAAGDAVENLKSNLNKLNEASYKIINNKAPASWFERGSITNGVNDTYREGSRARTANILCFDSSCFVSVTSGQFIIFYYNNDDSYKNSTGWKNSSDIIAIPKVQKFRIMVTFNNSAPATQIDDLHSMVELLFFSVDSEYDQKQNLLNIIFEHGSLHNGSDDSYNELNRCRTKNICVFPFDVNIHMTDGSYSVHLFNNGVYSSTLNWKTNEVTKIDAFQEFRLIITSDPTTNVFSDLTELLSKLIIEPDNTNYDKTLSESRSVDRLNNISYEFADNSMPIDWFERGSITNGANDSYRSGSRIRTKSILKFSSPAFVSVKNGYYFVAFYNDDETFDKNTTWATTGVTSIPADTKFRICLSPDNTAAASVIYDLYDMAQNAVMEVDSLQKHVKDICALEFEHGSLVNGQDDSYNGLARCRSVEICEFPFNVSVSMPGGTFVAHLLDNEGYYVKNSGWVSTKYTIPAHTKFRLLLALNATSNVYVSIGSLVEKLKIEIVESNVSSSIACNIEWACRDVDSDHIPPFSKWYVQSAAQNQYDRVRTNVRVTSDGHLFNCHDDYINGVARNPDGSQIESPISANGQTLATLNSYDWGIKYGEKYAGMTVPLFEDTIKWAAMYNLAVTWHSATALVQTDELIQRQLAIMDKYGVTDTMIALSANGQNLPVLMKFKAHNPRISFYVGGTIDFWRDPNNIDAVKELQTEFNKIYVQLYPWGTLPDSEFISIAKSNNFILYNSTTETKEGLLNENMFNKGFGLIEAANVYRIKDTVREWVNSLIDA